MKIKLHKYRKSFTTSNMFVVFDWILTQPHLDYRAVWRKKDFKEGEICVQQVSVTHMEFYGSSSKMRIPIRAWEKMARYIVQNKRPFDTRAFTVTRKGKNMLRSHRELVSKRKGFV